MTLDEAITALTNEFSVTKDGDTAESVEITSGGVRVDPKGQEPALFVSRDLAVASWLREAQGHMRAMACTKFKFIDGPHLDIWRITISNARHQHRTAEDRYSVTAKIGIMLAAPADQAA